MYVCVGNVRLLWYLSHDVIPFIPSRKAALVSPTAAAVHLPDISNDDDDGDPTSFANYRMDFTSEFLLGTLDGNLVTTGTTSNPANLCQRTCAVLSMKRQLFEQQQTNNNNKTREIEREGIN